MRVAVAVMCIVWGSTWLVLKDGLAEMPPLGSAGLRFLIAWAVMVPLAPVIARAEGGRAPTWDLVVAMATGNFAISYGLVYWAEEVLPSSLAAILWGVFPLITALVGHAYLPASRIVGLQWLGLVLGFAGVVMLFATDVEAVGSEARLRGGLLLLSPTVSAIATAYVKKHGADVSSALLNRSALLLGGALLALSALLLEGGADPVIGSRLVQRALSRGLRNGAHVHAVLLGPAASQPGLALPDRLRDAGHRAGPGDDAGRRARDGLDLQASASFSPAVRRCSGVRADEAAGVAAQPWSPGFTAIRE